MTARTVEASGMSVHRCHGGFQASNGTCAEQLSLFPPFSSTLALLVLVAVLVGIILVSLATFHFHKRKLQNRKIQRAQEEYERDSRSPTRVGARGEPARPCVIVRPVRREEKLLVCQNTESADSAAVHIKTFLKVKA
uniref:Si:dkey-35i13.1 n=1 Tax=Oryzias latipes TaxID=8090 RepID=A0A3B3HJ36_ORYLA